MRLVKNMPRLELGTRITLRKDKSQDIRTDQEEQEEDHAYSVSLSHEVFAGIWEKYPNVFRKCYSGEPGDLERGKVGDLGRFWRKVRNLDQWKGHPLQGPDFGGIGESCSDCCSWR